MRYRLISALGLSAAMALPAVAASGRAAITKAQIAAAISGEGIAISPQQVSLLSDVVAATESPTLKVQSIESWGDHRIKVRLDCAAQGQCLPFFVAVRLSQDSAPQPVLAALDRSPASSFRTRPDSKSFLVHAGSPATLLIEGGHVHIRLSVVCLENGEAGQTIRVASKDHRQTYIGQVIDGAVLRGSL